MTTDPAKPEFGAPLPASHPCDRTLEMLRLRRSTSADLMCGPGPDAAVLRSILSIASRTPDHRRVVPFRFVVFEGEGRTRAGEIIADAFRANEPDATPERVEAERRRFERAPVVIAVISCVDATHRTPAWEQTLTAGAVCQNLLLAACAHGFAAQWITEWYAYEPRVLGAFGVNAGEKVAGFLYIGSATEPPRERQRPEVESLITVF